MSVGIGTNSRTLLFITKEGDGRYFANLTSTNYTENGNDTYRIKRKVSFPKGKEPNKSVLIQVESGWINFFKAYGTDRVSFYITEYKILEKNNASKTNYNQIEEVFSPF